MGWVKLGFSAVPRASSACSRAVVGCDIVVAETWLADAVLVLDFGRAERAVAEAIKTGTEPGTGESLDGLRWSLAVASRRRSKTIAPLWKSAC